MCTKKSGIISLLREPYKIVQSLLLAIILSPFFVGCVAHADHTDLRGSWRFDNNVGGISTDSSGHALHATQLGGVMLHPTPLSNDSLLLDGENDYLLVSDEGESSDLDLTTEFTIALWINPSTLSGNQKFVSKDNSFEFEMGHAGADRYSIRLNNVRVGMGQATLIADTWQHLAVTWDGSVVTYFYNGYEDGSFPWSLGLTQNNKDLGLGGRPSSYSTIGTATGLFTGGIDNLHIYAAAQSENQVLGIYQTENKGLVARWRFDENSGAQANDDSTHSLIGEVVGDGNWVTSPLNGAVDLNGADAFIRITDGQTIGPLDLQSAFTLSAWVKPRELGNGVQSIISKDNSYEFEIGHAGTAQYSIRLNNLRQGMGLTALELNQWQHLAVTWDGGVVRYYYNGSEDGSTLFAGPILANNVHLGIGARSESVFAFDGLLDEVEIYQRPLNALEINNLYRAAPLLPAPDGQAISHWTLDENSGCQAMDQFSGNHGQLIPQCESNVPQWVGGVSGSALMFDGIDDAISVSNSNSLSSFDQLSVSAWIKHSATSLWRPIVDKRDSNADGFDLYIDSQSKLFFRINNNTLGGISTVADGEWHFVTGVYDGNNLQLYVDGELDASSTALSTSLLTQAPLYIGKHYSNPGISYKGVIDELRLFDTALSIEEVQSIYGQTTPPEPVQYLLVVNSGSGGGAYFESDQVDIVADPAPAGYIFSHWVGDVSVLAEADAQNTSLVMTTQNIEISAVYTELPPEYQLAVENGAGDGPYREGVQITVFAEDKIPLGYLFDYWSGDTQYLDHPFNASAVVTMPSSDLTITAIYKDDPATYSLRVENGMRGSGVYSPGESVMVMAANPDHGMQFKEWQGLAEDLTGIADRSFYWTSLTMPVPGRDVVIAATYEPDQIYVGNTNGYQPRANGLDLDNDGEAGEVGEIKGETDDLIPGGVPSNQDFYLMDKDIDGDGIAEDLIYVDAERGSDLTGLGTPASPYRTLKFALTQTNGADHANGNGEDVVIFHGVFYAVELDSLFQTVDIQDRLMIPHSGEPGGYTLDSDEHSIEVPTDPFRLMGWDYDNDGIYPPMDKDDVSILHGRNYRGVRAISNADGNHSYWELAHFTIEEYAGDPHPQSNMPAPIVTRGGIQLGRGGVGSISHIYIHDIEMRNLLNNWEVPYIKGGAEGHGVTFFTGASTLHHVTLENIFVNGFAGFFGRGSPGIGDKANGPYRFENMTLKYLRSTDRPDDESAQAIATGFKIWQWTDDVIVKNNIFDGQPDLWSTYSLYEPSGWMIRAGMENVKIEGNEFYDLHSAVRAVGDLPYPLGGAQDNIIIDGNSIINTFKGWTVTAQPHTHTGFLLRRGDDNLLKTTNNFQISNNFFYLDGGPNMVGLWLDGGNPVGPQPGTLEIVGNTFYGPGQDNRNAYGILSLDSHNYLYQNYVIKNNLFANWGNDHGGGLGGKNMFFHNTPQNLIADGNIFDAQSGFGWGDEPVGSLSEWQQITGEDQTSVYALPNFNSASSPQPQHLIDLHINANDVSVEATGVNISDVVTHDIDGDPRNGVGPFWAGADVRDGWDARMMHELIVIDGTGGGQYPSGHQISLQANPAPYGLVFSHWQGDVATMLPNVESDQVTVTMPDQNISIDVAYVTSPTFELNVTQGSGSGTYFIEHDRVKIIAEALIPGAVFDHWQGDTLYLENSDARTTYLQVPSSVTAPASINIYPVYRSEQTYQLVINDGVGSGYYGAGEHVEIDVVLTQMEDTFFWWTGDTQWLDHSTRQTPNIVVVPSEDINISAYVDRTSTTGQFQQIERDANGNYLWSNSLNWINGYIPRIVDIVEIGHDGVLPPAAVINAHAECLTLEIAEGPVSTSGSSLTINAGGLSAQSGINIGKDLSGTLTLNDGHIQIHRNNMRIGAHWPYLEPSYFNMVGGSVNVADGRTIIGGSAADVASSIGSTFTISGGSYYSYDGYKLNSKQAAYPAQMIVSGNASVTMGRFSMDVYNGLLEINGPDVNIQLTHLNFVGSDERLASSTGEVLVEAAPPTLKFSGDGISTIKVDGVASFANLTTIDISELATDEENATYTLINASSVVNAGLVFSSGTDTNIWQLEVDHEFGDLMLIKGTGVNN